MTTLDKNWQELANAIVRQAADDYLVGLTCDLNTEDCRYAIECEEFFDSEFYHLLTNVDGDIITGKLKRMAKDINDGKLKNLLRRGDKARINAFHELMPFVDARVLIYLIKNKFFSAPASRKYHGNYAGGLFDHSYEVAKTLLDLTRKNGITWERPESPLIIGMFHDICKMDNYIIKDGKIIHNPDTVADGHGDKSVMITNSLIELTSEEMACIQYHMGAFTEQELWNEYTGAIKRYPNVLWTHHADMIASHIKGV